MKTDPCLYCGVEVDEPTFMLNDGLCDECEQHHYRRRRAPRCRQLLLQDEMMDTQILRRPEPGQIWQHISGALYYVVAVSNTKHVHPDHPSDVVYRTISEQTGALSHWWTRPVDTWHKRLTYRGEVSLEHQEIENARLTGNAVGLYGRLSGCHAVGADHYLLQLKVPREDMPDAVVNNELVRVIFRRAKRPGVLPPAGEVCAANHTGHLFGAHGPRGATQCVYCGEPE